MPNLTEKQRRFALLYNGNGVQTAKMAGYKGNINTLNQSATKNLANPAIRDIINSRNLSEEEDIADKKERMMFWTSVMSDPTQKMTTRLEASKLLGKSQGDFIDKREVKTENTSKAIIKLPNVTPEQWEEMFENNLNKEDNDG